MRFATCLIVLFALVTNTGCATTAASPEYVAQFERAQAELTFWSDRVTAAEQLLVKYRELSETDPAREKKISRAEEVLAEARRMLAIAEIAMIVFQPIPPSATQPTPPTATDPSRVH